jgi:predicted transglutaminase-like cysteine proteinase
MAKHNISERLLLLTLALLVIFICGCSSQPVPVSIPSSPPVTQPVGTMSEVEIVEIGKRYGPLAEARVRHWQQMIRSPDSPVERDRLKQVNDFFNGARFVDDTEVWQQENYWATPLEFLIMDAGDCEDFSVAKYFTLEKMGVEMKKLRLTYVKALTLNKAHMVLAYYPKSDSIPLILDNLQPGIQLATDRMDLMPVYSFNGKDLWLAKTRSKQEKVGKADTLKTWKDLNSRIESGAPPLVILSP